MYTRNEKIIPIDIEEEYDNNIKGLYSDIVSFISKASTIMTPEQGDEMFRLRAAGRDIAEAIKDTKHMHKNLSQYIVSRNQDIRAEYNKLRVGLGSVLRRLETARQNEGDATAVLALDTVSLEIEEHDAAINKMLEQLIRENRISAKMATSLMNDTAYAYDVARNLVQMGKALFARGSAGMKEARRSIALDEDDAAGLVT